MAQLRINNNDTILFVGDSITDCGRRGAAMSLGDGYVRLFTELLAAKHPELQPTIINTGIGGNKVDDLRNRWQDDVMRHDFSWLSVMIGINDIHRQLREPASCSTARFREDYDTILAAAAAKTANIILIDPFYISTDGTGIGFRTKVLELLAEYLDVVDELARKYAALHLRTHSMFATCLKHQVPDIYCPEPVHPNRTGHLAIALEIYRLLGGTV